MSVLPNDQPLDFDKAIKGSQWSGPLTVCKQAMVIAAVINIWSSEFKCGKCERCGNVANVEMWEM
jgi:hypothetical protein